MFIDESGHATETETLIAIAGLLTCEENAGTVLGQIVLAGDPQQLGPIIHSTYAKHYGFGKTITILVLLPFHKLLLQVYLC